MIISYSLIMAVILFNLAMVAIAVLRKRTGYLTKFSTTALVWLALFGALRLILPLSFPFTYVVRSFEIMPAIESVLKTDLWPWSGRFELQALLFLIWGVGAAVVLLRSAIMFRKDYMRRRGYRIVENAQVDRILQRLRLKHARVAVSPDIGVPYVTGLVRARIYLPDMEISDDMLEVIIKHEYRHFISRDILIKVFYLLLTAVLWWNPVVHVFQRELDRLLEIRCDAAMTKRMDEDEKITYLQSLLVIMRHVIPEDAIMPVNTSAFIQVGQSGFVEQRFHLVLDSGKARPARTQIVSVALVVMVFLASFLIIIQPAHKPSVEDIEGIYTINNENSYILFTKNNTYELYIDGKLIGEISETSIEQNDEFNKLPLIYEGEIIE